MRYIKLILVCAIALLCSSCYTYDLYHTDCKYVDSYPNRGTKYYTYVYPNNHRYTYKKPSCSTRTEYHTHYYQPRRTYTRRHHEWGIGLSPRGKILHSTPQCLGGYAPNY